MSNPDIPWELLTIDPDTDAPRLMQDFRSILDWLLVEAVHRHHVQGGLVALGALTASTTKTFAGQVFSTPFPTNVTPIVLLTTNVKSSFSVTVTYVAYNITNTGFDFDAWSVNAVGSGASAAWMAFDPTYDVTL